MKTKLFATLKELRKDTRYDQIILPPSFGVSKGQPQKERWRLYRATDLSSLDKSSQEADRGCCKIWSTRDGRMEGYDYNGESPEYSR